MREDMIKGAVSFLQNDKVQDQTREAKFEFLQVRPLGGFRP